MRKLICVATAMLIVFVPTLVEAWGQEGHEVVGALAESMLSAQAKAGVHSVLAPTDTLSSVANWADTVRFTTHKESYNWHFVDIPRAAAGFDDGRDCFLPADTHPGAATDHLNCVVDRIAFFKQVLATSTDNAARLDALRFIVHFVGDIHQPFHAIGEGKGANDNKITEFGATLCDGKPCNLHHAWDTDLIAHTNMDTNAYVLHLQGLIAANHITATGVPADWANESHAAGNAAWVDNGGMVDEAYYTAQIPVIDQRLALASVRLAALLEDVFGTPPPPPTTAIATRNVRLRPDASTAHTALETIQKGATVTLLEPNKTNNFYHVKAADGKEGWVYSHYVKIQTN